MRKKHTLDLRHRPKVGKTVSISRPRNLAGGLVAEVTKISPRKIWLEFPRPTPQLPFQKGQQVWINYIEEGVLYCWDTKLVKITGPGNQQLEVSTRDMTAREFSTLRRKISVWAG